MPTKINFLRLASQKQKNTAPEETAYTIERVGGMNNIRPILSVQPSKPYVGFEPVKEEITTLIAGMKADHSISDMSIYLREYEYGRWISINGAEKYHPASLMKVALLISYLRMAESNPGFLDKELYFEAPAEGKITEQYYKGPSITPGKKYKVHDLLYYMIAYSDNNATWVLSQNFDINLLYKLFADVGLNPPVADEVAFTMTAKEFSTLFNVIYNSAYLTPEYSDYAAELHKNCSFAAGFVKGVDAGNNNPIWHKFGEWRHEGHDYELHESGIINIKGKPYLLTIMTKGKNTAVLADAISKASQKIYEKLITP